MAGALVSAAFSVVGKALAPFTDDLLKDWADSAKLGKNVQDLELDLLSVKALLEPALGRQIDNSALKELLVRLQDLGYDAEDVLDELEYFRIQDELNDTSDAADKHAKGCRYNLALNAKAVGKLQTYLLLLLLIERSTDARQSSLSELATRSLLISAICS